MCGALSRNAYIYSSVSRERISRTQSYNVVSMLIWLLTVNSGVKWYFELGSKAMYRLIVYRSADLQECGQNPANLRDFLPVSASDCFCHYPLNTCSYTVRPETLHLLQWRSQGC